MSCLDQISKAAKEKLLSSVYSNNYFLWIGSGFSYNFGFTSWNDILETVSKEIGYPLDLNISNPLKAAELLRSFALSKHKTSEYEFNSLIADTLIKKKAKTPMPSWVRRFKAFSPNMIVTTNWDNQIEEIFDGLINVVVRKDKCPQVSNTGRNLFKIHGDVGRPASIVVTQSQYFTFQREDTYLNRKIYTLFSEASPIFIGYSLTDPNINFLYDEVYAHLGEEKPPAYMIVHPSVKTSVLDESKLLFESKNIHIIKAEIGKFLEDISSGYKEYKKSNRRFFDQYKNIIDRLTKIVDLIKSNKEPSKLEILSEFNSKESCHQALSAITEILSNQSLFQDFGGKLLSPENRMPYRAIDSTITAAIFLVNEHSYPDENTRDRFHESVFNLCTKTDGVWDFYSAEAPFKSILRISPQKTSRIFNPRLKHIIEVLRWSAPSEIGKCWSTWNAFCQNLNWISSKDIQGVIDIFETEELKFSYSRDKNWITELINSSTKITEEQQKSLEKLLEN